MQRPDGSPPSAVDLHSIPGWPDDITKVLRGDRSVPWGPPVQVVALASFPPASPVDGQQCILELASTFDVIGGKIVRWLYVYNATDSVWDFIGGPPLFAEVATLETTASLTYADLATAGPSITIPRAGDYIVSEGFDIGSESSTAATILMSYAIGATAAVDTDAARAHVAAVQFTASVSRTREKTGLAANASLVAKYKTSAGTIGFENRWMSVLPVRIT